MSAPRTTSTDERVENSAPAISRLSEPQAVARTEGDYIDQGMRHSAPRSSNAPVVEHNVGSSGDRDGLPATCATSEAQTEARDAAEDEACDPDPGRFFESSHPELLKLFSIGC